MKAMEINLVENKKGDESESEQSDEKEEGDIESDESDGERLDSSS